MKRGCRAIGLIACFLLLLSGCFSMDKDYFYALPKRTEKYRDLQAAAEQAMGSGEYSAPVAGSNRQAVQQADLDGDGTDEALIFCKIGAERPLKVLILKQTEEDYRVLCTLEGDGTAFDSVEYAQVDNEPGMEILLSRRIGEQVQQYLTVYSLRGGTAKELMSSPYTASATLDMDGDLRTDLFLVRANADGPNGFADLYRYRDGAMQKDNEASLSTSVESVKRVITGKIAENVPAVFVGSALDESHLITDVFALRDNVFTNISQNAESGQSSQTVRNYYVYSTDIDGDGVIEMPNTLPLTPLPNDESSEGQYRIAWYSLGVNGERTEKVSTYHNYAEGWFFFLPDAWCENLAVDKVLLSETQSGTRFCVAPPEGGAAVPLLTIAVFSGENADARLQEAGCLLLGHRGELSYGAQLGEGAAIDTADLKNRFNSISPDLLPEIG